MRIRKYELFTSDASMAIHTPKELQDPRVVGINRLSPRATMVPAQKRDVFYMNKEESDRFFSLNGTYRFALFSDDAPEEFLSDSFCGEDWDDIDVPSMWQFRGYAEPTYPNVEYPFPFSPPYVLRLNPVGCYIKEFEVDELSHRAILHFAGVDNAFYVYLNGEFVGLSKGSRLPHEFDITPFIKKGKNVLKVKVYTYSDATYLENQDMLMANGIFRDVFIIFSPKVSLRDWEMITDDKTLKFRAYLWDKSNALGKLCFMGKEYELEFSDGACGIEITPESVETWNAEAPNLYDLYFELYAGDTLCEVHSKRIGFVKTEIRNRQWLINGKPILVKGINRHENNCDNGRYITVEQIRADLELIKSHNINAIRCAHYTNHPAFYEIASELGLYIMDECDLESHGCGVTGDQGFINKSPAWRDAFMDRIVRMAERDKNETCIVIWSVGNEIGTGENCEACAQYLRDREDKKPVQYHAPLQKSQAFIGNGYCNRNRLVRIHDNAADTEQPICLIEYAHGMGNGPGGLKEIWDYVTSHPRHAGGYVWEFRSHGMRRYNEDGTVDYLYGGDFHDDNHWSNFTLDGFCTSDGTPKPSMLELKYVYAPVGFKLENGVLTVKNTQDFLSTERFGFVAELVADGETVDTITLNVPAIEARQSGEIALEPDFKGVERFVTLKAIFNGDTVALEQFELESNVDKAPLSAPAFSGEYTVDKDKVFVKGAGFEVDFANGLPVRYVKDGKVYFDKPMCFVTHRAETDNDGIVKLYPRWIGSWERSRLDRMSFFTLKTEVEDSNGLKITATGILTQDHCYMGFNIEVTYSVYNDGLVTAELTVKPYGDMPVPPGAGSTGADDPLTPRLPRFGMCVELDKEFNSVKWYGRGTDQCYDDSKYAAPVGIYELPIEKMNFSYDVPQETGSRCDTRYALVKSDKNVFAVYGNDTFSFQYHPWALKTLREARHLSELKEADKNFLYIDYRMRALGSFSCGPNPEREVDFEPHDFIFTFAFNGESDDSAEYGSTVLGTKTQKLTEVYTRVKIETEREIIECRNE